MNAKQNSKGASGEGVGDAVLTGSRPSSRFFSFFSRLL